jgi:siderophore synthetase component
MQKRVWENIVRNSLSKPWDDVIVNYIACLCSKSVLEQFAAMEAMVKALIDFFINDHDEKVEQGWATGVLRVALPEFRRLATKVCMALV